MPRADLYDNKATLEDTDELVIWDATAGAVKNVTPPTVATRMGQNFDEHGAAATAQAAATAVAATDATAKANAATAAAAADATTKVSDHTAAADPHGDRAFATAADSTAIADEATARNTAIAVETAAVAAAAAAALASHEADTSVHGIADTALLETATGALTKADAAQAAATAAAATDATTKANTAQSAATSAAATDATTKVAAEATARDTAIGVETAARIAADVLKADLVDGLIPTAQLPGIALTNPLPVADEAAMLALAADVGDVAIRTDGAGSFILAALPASTLGNWLLLSSPAAVDSVNSQTGTVVIAKGDVGLGNVNNTTDANKPVSTAQATADSAVASAAAAALASHEADTTSVHGIANTALLLKTSDIGVTVQARDADLDAIAALGSQTAYGRGFLALADAAALGVRVDAAGAIMSGDTAGGVLTGTFPNPTIADAALTIVKTTGLQAALDAKLDRYSGVGTFGDASTVIANGQATNRAYIGSTPLTADRTFTLPAAPTGPVTYYLLREQLGATASNSFTLSVLNHDTTVLRVLEQHSDWVVVGFNGTDWVVHAAGSLIPDTRTVPYGQWATRPSARHVIIYGGSVAEPWYNASLDIWLSDSPA